MLLPYLFIITALCYQNVLGSNKFICNFDNSDCLTKGAQKTYEEIMNEDVRSALTPSDPLYVEQLEANLPNLKYIINNVTLSGMKSCSPELVKVNSKDMLYVFYIACKHLIMEGEYETSGEVASMFVEGKGDFKTVFYDYVFLINGEYELHSDKNDRLHLRLKNFNLDIDARCKVVYDFKNLYYGDSKKSEKMHKFLNENWKQVDKCIRSPGFTAFMTLYIKNVNTYMKETPIENLFNYEA